MSGEIAEKMKEYDRKYVKIVFRDSRKIKGFVECCRPGDGQEREALICLATELGCLFYLNESEISSIEIDREKRGADYHRSRSTGHRCPVCGKAVFLGEYSTYDICPECGWEDDRIMEDSPNEGGGANEMSLNEYRKEYRFGWRPAFLYEDDDWE